MFLNPSVIVWAAFRQPEVASELDQTLQLIRPQFGHSVAL
jgi:hypothetical protein